VTYHKTGGDVKAEGDTGQPGGGRNRNRKSQSGIEGSLAVVAAGGRAAVGTEAAGDGDGDGGGTKWRVLGSGDEPEGFRGRGDEEEGEEGECKQS
jgi:hypothetical protein